jgi:fatty acid desaturase
MKATDFPIPGRLNLLIAAVQLTVLLLLIHAAGHVQPGWPLFGLALGYGLAMNSMYATLHEAEHNIFHPNSHVNETVGIIAALFFPAPFHLLRQGHLGHHLRNRSDDEAFDFYFESDSRVWKNLALYGILTGFFWLMIQVANLIALAAPWLLQPKYLSFDRQTAAFMQSLNPCYRRNIQLEAAAIYLLHGSFIFFWHIPLKNYAIMLCGFGLLWSTIQYVHHYGTIRDVQKGARNLKMFFLIDWLLLNHNWHLNHHMNPTLPWIYLPKADSGQDVSRGSLLMAYLRMWRGPKLTNEHVQNLYAGVVIR